MEIKTYETGTKEGLDGRQAWLKIDNQTFFLQPVAAIDDPENTEEKAKWYEECLKTALNKLIISHLDQYYCPPKEHPTAVNGERQFTLQDMIDAVQWTYKTGKVHPGNNLKKDTAQYFKEKHGININQPKAPPKADVKSKEEILTLIGHKRSLGFVGRYKDGALEAMEEYANQFK